jgi:hypothetical protein
MINPVLVSLISAIVLEYWNIGTMEEWEPSSPHHSIIPGSFIRATSYESARALLIETQVLFWTSMSQGRRSRIEELKE